MDILAHKGIEHSNASQAAGHYYADVLVFAGAALFAIVLTVIVIKVSSSLSGSKVFLSRKNRKD